MYRRELLLSGVGAGLVMLAAARLSCLADPLMTQNPPQEEDPLDEGGRGLRLMDEEAGDPDSEIEPLNVNRDILEKMIEDSLSRGIKKNPQKVATKQLEIASSYVGVSRDSNPDQVNRFLTLF